MALDLTLSSPAQGRAWSAAGWGKALFRPPFLLYAPATLFLAVFFLAPLGLVVWMSVSEPTVGFDNYAEFFASKYDLNVLVRTSFLVRTYAWMVILGARGPVVGLLVALGVTPPPRLLFTTFAATFAMAHMLVPFMVLALYAVMKRIDEVYMRAAASLGARPLKAFLTVYLPQSLPGVLNGATLVFITCLGFYVTPTLIGSPQDKMIAGRIGQQIEQLLEFGAASATSMVLLAAAVALFVVYDRLFGIEKMWR